MFIKNWLSYTEELQGYKTIEELEQFIEKHRLLDKQGELLNINSKI